MVENQLEIQICDETVTLLSQRALYWAKEKLLVVSDLHWGKTEVFQQFGVRVPKGVLEADLVKLGEAVVMTRAEKLLILGDLIHHRSGIDKFVDRTILNWRKDFTLPMELIEGNHDRGVAPFLEAWNILSHTDLKAVGPFLFSHEGLLDMPAGSFNWSGHLHPVIRVRSFRRGDSLRVPCFYLTERNGVLPAFSQFTGGQEIRKTERTKVYSIIEEDGEGQVLEL